ncbi:uncharacterized protein LOC101452077 [Ceratitis capitata]|uniref:(Mediterranean fruit fly) hypothetical protein n=1 Tax=Ceratitis capitata TaxID=7213 RepID=A0A811VDN3_CERCA|nr:uncharacterized protein LOC101452077 [Ceratitis capitata]CAD7013456.1 unnamed protein product [Ceratitis capitata]
MGPKIETEFYLRLIRGVRANPCLYEKNHKYYYNRNKRNEAWQEVAAQSGRPENECKARWKLLRERFCKQMKRTEGLVALDGSDSDNNDWEYYKELVFLRDSIIPRRSRKGKDESCSLEEPTINEVFINVGALSEDESCSSNSLFTKCTKRSLESSNKSSEFDLAPLKIERMVMDSDFHKSEKDEIKSSTYKDNNQSTALSDNSIDDLFVKNIAYLMRELPIEVKDRFQADMYAEVYRLRAQYRNY